MAIRKLNYKDLDAVNELSRAFGESDMSMLKFKVLLRNRGRNHLTYVAEVDGKVVGIHTILLEFKLIHNGSKVAHFEDLIVLPEYRNQGIGEELLANSLKVCEELGVYKAIWSCDKKLVKYYERTLGGFKTEVSMRRNFD